MFKIKFEKVHYRTNFDECLIHNVIRIPKLFDYGKIIDIFQKITKELKNRKKNMLFKIMSFEPCLLID